MSSFNVQAQRPARCFSELYGEPLGIMIFIPTFRVSRKAPGLTSYLGEDLGILPCKPR